MARFSTSLTWGIDRSRGNPSSLVLARLAEALDAEWMDLFVDGWSRHVVEMRSAKAFLQSGAS